MYELRPYQAEAKQAVLSEWHEGRKKTLLVLPTGAGKTIVFASIAETQVSLGHRVLIMAHREELLEQAADKLRKATGLESVLEKADASALGSDVPVTVGSVQSLMQPKRLAKFPNDYYQDIIVDEAHHAVSKTYQTVLEHFPDANVLGVTATPDRGDLKDLGKYFNSLAYEYSLIQAVNDNYLCDVEAQTIPLKLDIRDVGISNGDYAVGGIARALEPYLHQIAAEMEKYCKGHKTVVFLPLIATSQLFCAILNDETNLKAAEVNGNSPDRAEILADFEAGKYDVLCNAMLLTEGWDCTAVDCIVVLRPTKIRSLYQQMVGRGMRLHPGKTKLLLLDFLWMTERHDLCRPSAILSKTKETKDKVDELIENSEEAVDLIEAEEAAKRDVIAEREAKLAEELRRMRRRKSKLVNPLQYAVSILADDLVDYEPTFMWEMEPASEKQIALLEKRGIATGGIANKGMACKLINRLILRQEANLSTPKQIQCLERYGFSRVGEWSFTDAQSMISRLAKNGWELPHGLNPEKYNPKGRI